MDLGFNSKWLREVCHLHCHVAGSLGCEGGVAVLPPSLPNARRGPDLDEARLESDYYKPQNLPLES